MVMMSEQPLTKLEHGNPVTVVGTFKDADIFENGQGAIQRGERYVGKLGRVEVGCGSGSARSMKSGDEFLTPRGIANIVVAEMLPDSGMEFGKWCGLHSV